MPDSRAGKVPSSYLEALGERGFLIEEQVGFGAFGTVYRGKQERLGDRAVAIKFLDRSHSKRVANSHKRFLREALLLARVEHPRIPYIITTGIVRSDQVPYYVMQFIQGEGLDTYLRERGRLSPAEASKVCSEILSALGAAHAHQVIHRDVKPDNVILSAGHSYLIDFSLGFCEVYEPGLTRLTDADRRLGVPDYMSPEQRLDASKVDLRTDLYSVGIILLQLLTGSAKIPTAGVRDALADYPSSLQETVARACADNPSLRFPTAKSFIEALATFKTRRSVPGKRAQVALCPNVSCEAAALSNGSGKYVFGPRILTNTEDIHCDSCGERLVRQCPGCGRPLPKTLQTLVSKQCKSEPDATRAHCGACGERLFSMPLCGVCGSVPSRDDKGTDVTHGCARCRKGKYSVGPF